MKNRNFLVSDDKTQIVVVLRAYDVHKTGRKI